MRVRYFLGRLGSMAFVIFGVMVITFVLTRLIPADPARVAAGPRATVAQVAAVRKGLGLDDPLPLQFMDFLGNAFRGNFGTSFVTNRPVSDDIARLFPATFELVFWAMVIMSLLGIVAGTYLSVMPTRVTGILVRALGLIGIGLPVFLAAMLAQGLFFGRLGWFPSGGRIDVEPPDTFTSMYVIDSTLTGNWIALESSLMHLALPVAVLAFSRFGVIMRFVNGEMVREINSEYVLTAHAKGAGRFRVSVSHALRNALIPATSMIGLQFGWLLGGTVLIESIFSWPGLGSYMVNSIVSLDYMPVISTAVVLGISFAVINLIVDVIQEVLDPRISA